MTLRFAPVPKCASRTLKAIGILGEMDGAHHRPITQYPDWQGYDWHMVTRPKAEWYASWWIEMRSGAEYVADLLGKTLDEVRPVGMKFKDMDADLALLSEAETLASLPERLFVNAWLPANCVAEYQTFLDNGQDLHDYCVATITASVPVKAVAMDELDAYLIQRGFVPQHINGGHYAVS